MVKTIVLATLPTDVLFLGTSASPVLRVAWTEFHLVRLDPARRAACKYSTVQALRQTTSCGQPEDRAGVGPHDPARAAHPRRRGHRKISFALGFAADA